MGNLQHNWLRTSAFLKMNTATLNSQRLWAYLQLMRPANIITAWADILAGFAASGYAVSISVSVPHLILLAWLLLATTGLYGGGVMLNDVFDADIDAKERPERPIPSGLVSRQKAAFLAIALLGLGILAATQVSWVSATLACAIAAAAILYDAYTKHQPVFGPLNMGVCRGSNLLLGVSVVSPMILENWFLALLPIIYIAAITTLSRGEVDGGKSGTSIIAILLIAAVVVGLLGLGLLKNYNLLAALPFVILLAGRVLLPFIQAVSQPTPTNIRVAVRSGILSLIVLDATIAVGFSNLSYGLLILILLPISIAVGHFFAVT